VGPANQKAGAENSSPFWALKILGNQPIKGLTFAASKLKCPC
jgi:hypothetical protein